MAVNLHVVMSYDLVDKTEPIVLRKTIGNRTQHSQLIHSDTDRLAIGAIYSL